MRFARRSGRTCIGATLAAGLAIAVPAASPGQARNELPVEITVGLSAGVYYFTGTCQDPCGDYEIVLRLKRGDGPVNLIPAQTEFGNRDADNVFRVAYRVRCTGPRAFTWRLVSDTAPFQEYAAGERTMPTCGPWRPDARITRVEAEGDVRQRIERRWKIRFRDDELDLRCHRAGRGRWTCKVEFFLGDNHVWETYALRYERRSGDEGMRHSIKRTRSRTVSEYPG